MKADGPQSSLSPEQKLIADVQTFLDKCNHGKDTDWYGECYQLKQSLAKVQNVDVRHPNGLTSLELLLNTYRFPQGLRFPAYYVRDLMFELVRKGAELTPTILNDYLHDATHIVLRIELEGIARRFKEVKEKQSGSYLPGWTGQTGVPPEWIQQAQAASAKRRNNI